MQWDVIIIGAGAAGLMAAITAGRRGRRVLVLEHMSKPGRKILISGGGRCNFTNRYVSFENYLSANPHFCKSALARYTPADFLALLKTHGIGWHEKKLGQLFCNDSATAIVDMLLKEARMARVCLRTGVQVHSVRKGDFFEVETVHETLQAPALIVATGGLSLPKVGATDLGYRLARHFGHTFIEPRPGLVPLIYGPADQALTALRGLALPTRVSLPSISFEENTLFTHFGLSGPAILQISSYWRPGQALRINFLPQLDLRRQVSQWQKEKNPQQITTLLDQFLPRRFVRAWQACYFPARPPAQLDARTQQQLCSALQDWSILPADTAGFAKAEVTVGGIHTQELSSRTLESRRVPGLYWVGEVVDVTGWLGGYNFQWAWASGHAAGEAV